MYAFLSGSSGAVLRSGACSAVCSQAAGLRRGGLSVASGRSTWINGGQIGVRSMGKTSAKKAARDAKNTKVSMKLQTGIVGLPNVGKSTLFNALVENAAAQAANFPFCTIDPNVGVVSVQDERLDKLSDINNSAKTVPTTLEFVDIAGLVAGASKGEGLGNQFLANIRECDAIVHVVRCFDDENIIHVAGSVEPVRDIEVINLELGLADLNQVEKRLQRLKGKGKGKEGSPEEISGLEKIEAAVNDGGAARSCGMSPEEEAAVKHLGLLTMKPVIFAANVADADLATGNEWVEQVKSYAKEQGAGVVLVSAQVESELVQLPAEDRGLFLEELGVTEGETGLKALVKATYSLLNLKTYFTSGPTETRAWTIVNGMTAPQAAGVIHTDFQRGFIRAETISYEDLVSSGSEKVAKEKGLMRSEGKEYVVAEGDVMLFRFNV